MMKHAKLALAIAGLLFALAGIIGAGGSISPVISFTCAVGQFANSLDPNSGVFSCGQPSGAGANLVFNAGFRFDQVNEGAAVSVAPAGSGIYCGDMWKLQNGTTVGQLVNCQRSTDAPQGGANSILITTTTSAASGTSDYMRLKGQLTGDTITPLGYGAAGAQSTYLSFWLKSSIAPSTWSATLRNVGNSRLFTGSCAIASASTWTQCGFVIPGDVGGAWAVSGQALAATIEFTVNAGSSIVGVVANTWATTINRWAVSGQTNLLETASATWQLSNVKWEVGTVPTPYLTADYAIELKRLQRFYAKTFPQGTAVANNAGLPGALCTVPADTTAGSLAIYWSFPAEMASTPATVTTYNPQAANANWRDVTGAADAVALKDPLTSKSTTGLYIGEQTTALVLAHNYCIHATADARP